MLWHLSGAGGDIWVAPPLDGHRRLLLPGPASLLSSWQLWYTGLSPIMDTLYRGQVIDHP